eukprot:gene8007-5565_t
MKSIFITYETPTLKPDETCLHLRFNLCWTMIHTPFLHFDAYLQKPKTNIRSFDWLSHNCSHPVCI